MKHSLWICFLLALLVSGCSQEEMLRNGTFVSGKGRTFTTSFENDESRTYLEDGLYSRWTEGDRISLFDGSTQNREYKFNGKTGDNGGTFTMLSKPEGTGTTLLTNYAVYPYDKDMTISDKGLVTIDFPSEQQYAENSYGLGNNMMVAVTHNVYDTFLKFKNVGGCFKFQLYGDYVTVKSITLKGNNGEKIAGKATLTAAYDAIPSISMADDATSSITLDCGEKGVNIGSFPATATAFWLVVPPTVFDKGITITVTDMDGNVYTKTTDKRLAIERNIVKPMEAFSLIVPLPDLSGQWIFADGSSDFIGTLEFTGGNGKTATYKVINHNSFGTWGVHYDRKEGITVIHSGINWRENWIYGTYMNHSTIAGTKFVSSAGAVFDCNWTLSRINN